jgi:hypothetical protein
MMAGQPRIADAHQGLVAMMNVLVVGDEGGAVETAKHDRRTGDAQRQLELDGKMARHPHLEPRVQLAGVEVLVVKLARLGALSADGHDLLPEAILDSCAQLPRPG